MSNDNANSTKRLNNVPLILIIMIAGSLLFIAFFSIFSDKKEEGQKANNEELRLENFTPNNTSEKQSVTNITSTMTRENIAEKEKVEIKIDNSKPATVKEVAELPEITKDNIKERPRTIELLPEQPKGITLKYDKRYEEYRQRRKEMFLAALTANTKNDSFATTTNKSLVPNETIPNLSPHASYEEKMAFYNKQKNQLMRSVQNNSSLSSYNDKLKIARELLGKITGNPAALTTNINSRNQNNSEAIKVQQRNFTLKNQLEETKPYTINTGFVIPATTITGINSDLSGSILAQVSQNVYDTSTGRYLLIPQGTKIYGQYKSNVQFQQKRLFVAWHRLVYPDGKTLDLGSMAGTDLSGYSGFNDLVDNHYWDLFKGAFLLSVVNGSVTYAENTYNDDDDDDNARSAMSESLSNELGSVTTELIRKYMNVSPTLIIRPGYKFNIIVSKDIVFSKPFEAWR